MNQYHIYDKIGKGQHSVVYKGRKKKTINYYAIKSVEKSQKSRVLQEVRTMYSLNHDNILKFFAWYETSNHLWLILEYCVGGDLLALLKQDTRLPETSVHDFARDLVASLQHLHSNSIIYCDLKPSNILLDENGRLKLGGFGLSRRLSDINKTPLQNLNQAKRGTPYYMAPELFSEGATHSTASDLWSLGCVLYECATGRPPFTNSLLNQLVMDILHKDPPVVSGFSQEFQHLLSRLLDKNPATRAKWSEIVVHPFWKCRLQLLDLPPEPALDAFIQKYNLAPVVQDTTTNSVAATDASERAKSLRQSVDVMRLSRIAMTNLEKEGDGVDDPVAEPNHGKNDVKMETTDAELDFEETNDDDEEESVSPSATDEGSVMDSAVTAASEDGSMIAGAVHNNGGVMGANKQARDQAVQENEVNSATIPSATSSQSPANPFSTGVVSEHPPLEDMDNGVSTTDDGLSIDAILWQASDNAVKPIVGNRRIERLPEPRYDARSLPFTPISAADLAQMVNQSPQTELENFLVQVYKTIAGTAPLKDKVNVLSYFETLCLDTTAANVLINSSVAILFIRMLRQAKAPTLRIRLASALGLLIRHATYIADELAQTGIIEILCEVLKDKNEKVRRRGMATLGELLFYIATQQQDASGATTDIAASCWNSGTTSATLTSVIRMLKLTEDETAQHYAVKTIENICSQGGDWVLKFATNDVMYNLVQVYTSGRGEGVKATAASTIARLLRHSPTLVQNVMDRLGGTRLFVAGLNDNSSKVQLACLNIVNLTLVNPDLGSRVRSQFAEERSLMPSVVSLLDHSSAQLRAKACVTVLLLCRLSSRWLLEGCRVKLVPCIERLAKDRDESVQKALVAMRGELAKIVPAVCQAVSEELSRYVARKGAPATPPRAPQQQNRNALTQFQVVLHLVTSPYFRPTTVTPTLISDLAQYLRIASTSSQQQLGSQAANLMEFKSHLMHVLEALCQQAELLLEHHMSVLDNLLPALCDTVAQQVESGDIRLLCLRMISDVITLYVVEPELYASGQTVSGREDVVADEAATAAIDKILQFHLLPLIPMLLQKDEEPMPLYALKLLGGLLEVNMRYVRDIQKMGLASSFFEYLQLDHRNNNVHNIRLCRHIITAGSLSGEELVQLRVADKVVAVLSYAHANHVEPFLEPILELCHAVIERDHADLEAGLSDGSMILQLLGHLPIFIDLCAHPDMTVALAASTCTLGLVMIYPAKSAKWLLTSSATQALASALQSDQQGQQVVQVQQHLLAALSGALSSNAQAQATNNDLKALMAIVKHLQMVGDPSVKPLAIEASGYLSQYVK